MYFCAMNHLGDIFFSGLLIGILISAPMGPIGMLCIQRTLNKGRWPAFCTGIGAALSDLLYCLLTGLGLALITNFIEEHRGLLQFLGSIVLIVFGIYLFRKNPVAAFKKPSDKANNYWIDFLTGFLFTFSNPLILFFIIGLFTQFDFLKPEFMFYHYIAGYIAIFVGALLWWYAVTFFVNKVRSHINVRSLWLINRIIGSLLILMAIGGMILSISEGLGFEGQ